MTSTPTPSSSPACKAVETAGNNPEKFIPKFKAAGIKVIHKCTRCATR